MTTLPAPAHASPAGTAHAAAAGTASATSRYAWQRSPPRTAGIRRRATALGLDLAVVFVLAWAATFIAAASGVLRIPDVSILGRRSEVAGLFWIVSIFELPITLLYFTLCEALAGRTLGKLLMGLRVRRIDGHRVGLFDSFLRNLLRLLWVTPFGPAFFLLDYWSLRMTELDQRLGDLAADTVVLDERVRW